MQQKIRSVNIEKHVLAGFIKHPKVYHEVAHYISEADFTSGHKTIFSVIKNQIVYNQPLDAVIISEKIKNLGVSFNKQDFNIFDYIESLTFLKISEKSLVEACKDLKTVTIRREICDTAGLIQEAMVNSGEKNPDQIVSLADKMYNDKISAYDLEYKPEDLFANIEQLIEERGKTPVSELGFLTPYKIFNQNYGGLRPGELYAWVSRPKEGKALREDTLIPTPKGFTEIGEIQVGDEVFAIDGTITKVLAITRWENRDTFQIITDDNNVIYADEDHEWLASINGAKPEIYTTKVLSGLEKTTSVMLPVSLAIQLPTVELPIDPYILGTLLAYNNQPISDIDEKIVDQWLEYFKPEKKAGAEVVDIHAARKSLLKELKELEILNQNCIPMSYLRASEDQRFELFKGIFHNKYVNSRNELQIDIIDERLAHEILDLVYTLGSSGSIRQGHSCYTIVIYKDRVRYITVEPSVKSNTVCIQIDHPSHMFLCGEAMIPTHNSTILNDIATKATIINPNLRALVLDTEMQTSVMKFRIASAITGIPMWYLETGNFRNNAELLARWNSKKTELSMIQGKVNHMQVAGKPTEEVESIIQRWYLSEVGRGNPAIVVYDYIKLTGEQDGDKKEYQLIGDKVDRFKNLSVRLGIPILTACQLNRSAEKGVDDSSAIAQSDRLQWFAAYVGIFRRKTLEETVEDGVNFGTHKMIELAARYQGKSAHGHSDLVKIKEGNKTKYKKNFISFDVQNFNVQERGTLQDIVDAKAGVKVDVFDRIHQEIKEEREGELL